MRNFLNQRNGDEKSTLFDLLELSKKVRPKMQLNPAFLVPPKTSKRLSLHVLLNTVIQYLREDNGSRLVLGQNFFWRSAALLYTSTYKQNVRT